MYIKVRWVENVSQNNGLFSISSNKPTLIGFPGKQSVYKKKI